MNDSEITPSESCRMNPRPAITLWPTLRYVYVTKTDSGMGGKNSPVRKTADMRWSYSTAALVSLFARWKFTGYTFERTQVSTNEVKWFLCVSQWSLCISQWSLWISEWSVYIRQRFLCISQWFLCTSQWFLCTSQWSLCIRWRFLCINQWCLYSSEWAVYPWTVRQKYLL